MGSRLQDILTRITRGARGRYLPLWNISDESSSCAVLNAIPWLLAANEADADQLGDFLAALMRRTAEDEWTQLDRAAREFRVGCDDVRRLEKLAPNSAVELLGVATLSRDGFARQAALEALARLGHCRAVPYALLRLADWVLEVRDAALATLRRLPHAAMVDELLSHHRLLSRLRRSRCDNRKRMAAEVETLLRTEEARPAVEGALNAECAAIRLLAYRLLENDADDRLREKAINDPCPEIRLWLVRQLALAPGDASAELMARLLHDRASRVSTAAVRMLTPGLAAALRNDLVELTVSDTRPNRFAAREALRRLGDVSFADIARRRLHDASPEAVRPGVIASLGEMGEREDAALVRPFLDSPSAGLRAAAVVAYVRLGGAEVIGDIVCFLDDPSSRVRCAAARALRRADLTLWLSAIREILHGGSALGQARALRVLSSLPGWDPVPDFLSALASDSEQVRRRAWLAIGTWQRRYGEMGWVQPSVATASTIAERWSQIKNNDVQPPDDVRTEWAEFRRRVDDELREQGLLE